ncbi:MAG: FkbM family methyltransferase [Phycisphaerae bacterium]|nr:FkbM family methyltransferase [Phycisphaerae bacterium]
MCDLTAAGAKTKHIDIEPHCRRCSIEVGAESPNLPIKTCDRLEKDAIVIVIDMHDDIVSDNVLLPAWYDYYEQTMQTMSSLLTWCNRNGIALQEALYYGKRNVRLADVRFDYTLADSLDYSCFSRIYFCGISPDQCVVRRPSGYFGVQHEHKTLLLNCSLQGSKYTSPIDHGIRGVAWKEVGTFESMDQLHDHVEKFVAANKITCCHWSGGSCNGRQEGVSERLNPPVDHSRSTESAAQPGKTVGDTAMKEKQYLSIVAVSRNDNHGGNLLERTQLFVDGIGAQSSKFGLAVELVLVEWNPLADRPGLAEALSWPASHDCCAVRIIQVPPTIHQKYAHAASLPLYQMIAKNVGIRRAIGDFILSTNVDILLSDELFEFVASRRLRQDRLYRVDRHDVQRNVPLPASHETRLAFCRANTFRINKRNGTINLLNGEYHEIYPEYGRTHRERLHTNASGDFQLMHRDRWFALHGYPEFDMYSFHLDSLMCYMAHFGGAPEHFLDAPMCIYHIEHEAGWTPESDKENGLWQRLEKSRIPRMTNDQLHAWANKMTAERRAAVFNDDNWGHGTAHFEECRPIGGLDLPQEKPAANEHSHGRYLSIVVTSRNDDHGGNTLHRTQVFTKALIHQCRKYNLDAELVFVEWNPPPDRPRLYDVLDLPEDLGPLAVRFIEVPLEVHNSIGNADKFPLFQMVAKNVGIRRAAGRFVLATNIDILFSDEVMEFLASGQPKEDCFYRIDRHDVGACRIPEELDCEAQLDFCKSQVIRIQGLGGTKTISEIGSDHYTYTAADTKLHTNACGDFTLMSREVWHRLRAYPELPLWSIYVDGLLLHMASAEGLRQVILEEPLRIYHIEHETGWEVIPQTMQQRPSLDHNRDYLPWCRSMIEKKRPITNNGENWGYAGMDFAEKHFRGYWRARHKALSSSDPTAMFQDWIETFTTASNRLYYRDQTVGALTRLYHLVAQFKPTRIIELGTLSGMSLRTWLAAAPDAEITAIDLSFDALRASQRLIPLDLSCVRLIEQDILKVDFASLWSAEDRVLLYIDAHDQADVPLMKHLLDRVIGLLPRDSIVGIDDLWYSADAPAGDTFMKAIDEVTLFGVDPLQCFEGYFAPYWKGGFWIGFQEVVPLMEWVNAGRVELMFEPGDKAVFFRPACRAAGGDFDVQRFRQHAGRFNYNPVDQIQVIEQNNPAAGSEAEVLCKQAAQLFAQRRIQAALHCLEEALKKTPDIRGALYAQAVCYAAMCDFESALIACDVIASADSHRRKRILRQDIERHIDMCRRRAVPAADDEPRTSAELAIFTVPKPFKGHIGTIQRNAIESWMRLNPKPEIILLGDDEGTACVAAEWGLTHVPHIECNEVGTPLLDSIFRNGASASAAPVLAYVNTDILILDDFTAAVKQVRDADRGPFLMIGQRWDLNVDRPLNFTDDNWSNQLRGEIRQKGTLHPPAGIDYFVFSRDLWPAIPPFALGRTVWDNWLVAEAIRLKAAVVDATECVTVVHQNHDYGHLAGGQEEAWKGTEARRNLELAGGYGNMRSASYAPCVLTSEGILSRTAILNEQGEAAFHQGDHEKAMQCFSQCVTIEPDNIAALNNLGVLHWQKQRVPEALACLETAWKVQPNCRDTLRNIVAVYIDLHRETEAAKLLGDYLHKHADDDEMRTLLKSLRLFWERHHGFLQGDNHDEDRFLKMDSAAETAAQESMHDRAVQDNQRGVAFFQKGDVAAAMDAFQQALRAEPANVLVRNNLALLYWQTDRPRQAMETLTAALRVDPNNRRTVLHLIGLYKALSLTTEAAKLIQIYLKKWGDDPQLNAEMASLRGAVPTAPCPDDATGHAAEFAGTPRPGQQLNMQVLGTEYGGWAVDIDLIPAGSTVISAGVGEDISFDMRLVELRNCTIIGVDPTEKARDYIRRLCPPNFQFLQKALHPQQGARVRMYRNSNPDHVSESVKPTHKSVLANDSYEAETVSLPHLLRAYPNVSVLKMDIEGAEYDVLNALERLTVPQLCVEFHHACTDYTVKDTMACVQRLGKMGYICAHTRSKAGPFHEVTFVHQDCIDSRTGAGQYMRKEAPSAARFAVHR